MSFTEGQVTFPDSVAPLMVDMNDISLHEATRPLCV